MSLFYFDLIGPDAVEPDEMGLEFANLDDAYLEAVQAVGEITLELLRKQQDASRYRFEIRTAARVLALELPFSEVLRPSRPPRAALTDTHERVRESLERSRTLKAELTEGLVKARASIETARATLARGRPS